jgi:MFS family permease
VRVLVSDKTRFWILIIIITISGFSQGMLMPLISVIFEQNNISSSVSGLHATGLYLGILIASPFMEMPLRKFGYKPIILTGGILVFLSLALFPVWQAIWFWFVLRMAVGIGDQMIHFGTQTWITSTATKETRGRSISFYGLSFGLGFALGPMMTRLLSINEALPFLVSALLSMLVLSLMLLVRNKWPDAEEDEAVAVKPSSSFSRFIKVGQIAWVALLPGFGYGFLEAALHSIFPIYGLRIGHEVNTLSLIIPCFALGSLITQIPLGILSDRFGRQNILRFVITIGMICFFLAAQLEHSVTGLFILFTVAGMFVGSLYSLGIAYMTDLLPRHLLPTGNLMVSITFSFGSMSGPILGGIFVDVLPNVSFFYFITAVLLLITIALFLPNRRITENLN